MGYVSLRVVGEGCRNLDTPSCQEACNNLILDDPAAVDKLNERIPYSAVVDKAAALGSNNMKDRACYFRIIKVGTTSASVPLMSI